MAVLVSQGLVVLESSYDDPGGDVGDPREGLALGERLRVGLQTLVGCGVLGGGTSAANRLAASSGTGTWA
jgi:hypothetical protein